MFGINKFINLFTQIIPTAERKYFCRYLLVLFLSSIFSILGIAAVIPFVHVLIDPKFLSNYSFLHSFSHAQILLSTVLLLIVAFVVKNLVLLLFFKYQANYLYGLVRDVRNKLFAGYIGMPYAQHLYKNTAEQVQNINNETTILADYIVMPLGILLTDLGSLIFVITLLCFLNFFFTLFIVICLALSAFIMLHRIKPKLAYYGNQRTEALSDVTELVIAAFKGIKEIIIYGAKDVLTNEFISKSEDLKQSSAYQFVYQQTPRLLIETISLAVILIAVCVMFFWGMESNAVITLLGVFGIASIQMLPAVNRIAQSIVHIRYGLPALEIINDELVAINTELSAVSYSDHAEKLAFNNNITLDNVSFVFPDGSTGLQNINAVIRKGSKTAIIGPSGAGKSTLVNILLGLYDCTAGEITIDGKHSLSATNLHSYQRLFSYVPQDIAVLDKNITSNIKFAEVAHHEAADITKVVKIAEIESLLASNGEAALGEGGSRISGGQRQRIGIARALYRNPQILVLDEATAAIDKQTEKNILANINALTDLTTVIITHNIAATENCDFVYVMDQGRIISSGGYNYLLENCDVFKAMHSAHN